MEVKDRAKRLEHLETAGDKIEIFAQRFSEALDDAGVTVNRLFSDGICSKEAGLAYKRGDRTPGGKTLLYICAYLNVSADWLLGISNEKRAVWS